MVGVLFPLEKKVVRLERQLRIPAAISTLARSGSMSKWSQKRVMEPLLA